MFKRSKRITQVEPPAPINPITDRPYGQPAPARDEAADAALAAGQAALATAKVPAPIQVGFDPQRCAWRGARN